MDAGNFVDDQAGGKAWHAPLRELLRGHVENWAPLFAYLCRTDRIGLDVYNDRDPIYRKGNAPEAFAVILEGEVDICSPDGNRFKGRKAGELIGEQAFLMASQPGNHDAVRTADIRAHGRVHLLTFHGDVLDGMPIEVRAAWFEFMAHLVNQKLAEASDERARQIDDLIAQSRLLARFCDKAALSLVQMAVSGETVQIPTLDAVVWFSDIAGFSSWAKGRPSDAVAAATQTLLGLQVDLIHAHGGAVDKLMGDGLMGFWFIDKVRPGCIADSLACARQVVAAFAVHVKGTDMAGLSLRIGLHCGDVSFGDFGTADRIAVTVIGEPVNLAARFEQLPVSDRNPGLGSVRMSAALRNRIADVDAEMASLIKGPQKATVKQDHFDVYWIEDSQ